MILVVPHALPLLYLSYTHTISTLCLLIPLHKISPSFSNPNQANNRLSLKSVVPNLGGVPCLRYKGLGYKTIL